MPSCNVLVLSVAITLLFACVSADETTMKDTKQGNKQDNKQDNKQELTAKQLEEETKIRNARGKLIATASYVTQNEFVSYLSERLSFLKSKIEMDECHDISDIIEASVTLQMLEIPPEVCSAKHVEILDQYFSLESLNLSAKFHDEIQELKDVNPLDMIDTQAYRLSTLRDPSFTDIKYFSNRHHCKYLRIASYVLIASGFVCAIIAVVISVRRQRAERRAIREAEAFGHAQLNMVLVKDV